MMLASDRFLYIDVKRCFSLVLSFHLLKERLALELNCENVCARLTRLLPLEWFLCPMLEMKQTRSI